MRAQNFFKGAMLSIAPVLFAAITVSAPAELTVTLTKVYDAATATGGTSVYASCYVPVADKFLASADGSVIKIIDANAAAVASGTLNLTGTNPTGLGFFALCADSTGVIYGYEDGATTLWRWANTAATPTVAATGVEFARSGHVIGTGTSTKIALTGANDQGDIQIWSTTDGLNFTLADTVPAAVPGAKSGFAINSAASKVWAVGDVSSAIQAATKTTSWAIDPSFAPPASPVTGDAGPMDYDNANNVVFSFSCTAPSNILYALNGNTGVLIGNGTSVPTTNAINGTAGYCGAYIQSAAGTGTIWYGRQATASSAFTTKYTYTVTGTTFPSSVGNWAAYN